MDKKPLIAKYLAVGMVLFFITSTIIPMTLALKEKSVPTTIQKITSRQSELLYNGGNVVEIYIYAGSEPNDTTESSYGFGVTIKVINHLSENIWVYFQEDYFSLLTGQPVDAFQWKDQFVASTGVQHFKISGGVSFPYRYRITVQADVFESVSRSGFQFRRFVFFPGET